MAPGTYVVAPIFTTVDRTPPSFASRNIQLNLNPPPRAQIRSVVSSATQVPSGSPGELVSILGTSLAPPGVSAVYDEFGRFPETLAGTSVTFNGIAAPILAAGPNRIDTMVPYGVAAQRSAEVVVKRWNQPSAPVTIPIKETTPAIQSIENFDFSGVYVPNTAETPAVRQSVIIVYATGAGVWDPPAPDNGINLAATPFRAKPVSLTVGGQAATLYYARSAPYRPWGAMQIIAYVPDGVDPGAQRLVLAIGDSDNSAQESVVFVK